MVSHHYIESLNDHHKGIVTDCLEANGLNVHKSSGCLVVTQVIIAGGWNVA